MAPQRQPPHRALAERGARAVDVSAAQQILRRRRRGSGPAVVCNAATANDPGESPSPGWVRGIGSALTDVTSAALPRLLLCRVAAAHKQLRVVQALQCGADIVADDIDGAGI